MSMGDARKTANCKNKQINNNKKQPKKKIANKWIMHLYSLDNCYFVVLTSYQTGVGVHCRNKDLSLDLTLDLTWISRLK